jgi:hypothetical protein
VSTATTADRPPAGRRRPAAAALALALAVLATTAGALLPPPAGADTPSFREPSELPAIRRVLLSDDGIPDLIGPKNRGVLRALPRAEFEEKVTRAVQAAEALRHPPKLAEARYRARLADGALVGTGQWKVVHNGGAGLLPLQPLNLALRQPRFENRDALIADFDGKTPALLLEKPGDHAVAIEWSARGEERPEGLHFDLKLPVSPVAVLELDLPADRTAAAADGSLISGPLPAEVADRRLWRISCGGRPGVDLWVRRAGAAARPTLLLARQFTTQTLEPEGLEARYQFDLEVLHREVGELLLEFDPELRPFEVVVAGLDGWEVRPPAKPGGPPLLAIRLREPLRYGRESLAVRCLAPLGTAAARGTPVTSGAPGPPPVDWRSPGMRLFGAVPRGETLVLVINPELRLDGLEAGDFRASGSSIEPAAGRPGQAQRLTFVGGGLAGSGGPPRRPAVRVQPYAVEYRARQLAWWQPAADPPSLTLQIGCEVERGRLFQLPVLLPPGWDADRVELSPAGLLRSWAVRPTPPESVPPDAPGGSANRLTLSVDLQQPLTAAPREPGAASPSVGGTLFGRPRVPTLTVRLVPNGTVGPSGEEMPFPDAILVGARFRDGVLAIALDPQNYQATIKTAAAEAELDEEGPWGRQLPDAVYRYRVRPVEGTLVLRPRPPQVRARCITDVVLGAGRAAMDARLFLEAEAGRPDTIDVSVSVPSHATPGRAPTGAGNDGWQWSVEKTEKGVKSDNAVKSFQRLYAAEVAEGLGALGCGHSLGAATLLAARPPGERWRLTLERPLRPRAPLELHAVHGLDLEARRRDVPLLSVTGARRMEGEVRLRLEGAEFVQVETTGLQEAPVAPMASGQPRIGTSWRTFRYGDASVSLTLRGRGRSVDRDEEAVAAEAVADQARLTSYLGADGAARHHLSFRMSSWRQRYLPVRLPPGARPVAVRADGHPVANPASPLTAEPGVLEIAVPFSAGGVATEGPLRFEVVYDTDAPPRSAWRPWGTFEAPVPQLPVPPLTFRRTWRLPPGVDPVPDGRQHRLPGVGGAPGDGVPRGLSESFLLATPLSQALAQHPAAEGQAEGLAAAAAGLRPKAGGKVVRIRELVAEMAAGFLNGRLVIDSAALREAGVGAESLLAIDPPDGNSDQSPPWEALGLSAVKAGPASLLTSTARARLWGTGGDPPALVIAAADEALSNGHDASGHYRTASDWIRHAAAEAREGATESIPDPGPSLAPWTEWEPAAGVADDATIVVVRRNRVLACAVLLAAVLLPCLWVFRRRDLVLVTWLGLAGIAALWLPSALRPLAWLPLLAGGVAALTGYLAVAMRRRASVGAPARAAVTAVALLAALVTAGGPGVAEESWPGTVYVVAGRVGDGGKETILAPPELLERLDTLARTGLAKTGPVLLAASYDGKAVGAVAEFGAVFEAYCPADGPAQLTLPLEGVFPGDDVLVDGAPALPAALPAPQVGFSVPLRGAGRHKVELHFRVPVVAEEGGRGVRFGAPRATQCRSRLALPAGATAVQALAKHGAQRVTSDAKGPVLEAELGRLTVPVHFRWMEEAAPGKVEVREAYLWDLTADGDTLTGCLDYRVTAGSVSVVTVDLPPGLEVQAAEARRPGPGDPVRLRDWRVAGSGPVRVLEVEFASPATGAFQVGLTLVPTAPPGADATLLVPTPHGQVSPERGHLAYRARGLRATRESTRWLTGGQVDAFAPFWPEATRPDLPSARDGAALYAATFHREGGQEPALRLHLAPAAPRLRVERQAITVHVFARQAEVEAALHVAAPDGDPAAMTCRIFPEAMTVSAVSGGARRWAQSGDKLTIWLDRDAAEQRGASLLGITGWLPFDADANRLVIPSVRVDGATAEPATVRLVPEPGLALSPVGIAGLRAGPAPEPELAFVAERPDYEGACEVRAGAAGAGVRTLTVAEVRERRLTFRSTVDFVLPHGDLRAATVRLRNWEGEDVKLEAEKTVPVRQRERRRAAGDRTWSLELRPGVTGRFRLTLSGSMPVEEAAAGISMPEVSVPGSGASEGLVAVAGPELSAEGADGLTAADSAFVALKDWPAEANHLRLTGGQVWKVARGEWALRLRPRMGAEAGPVRVLLADHTVVVADGRHWLHEAAYWIEHGSNADLNVLLPRPGTVVAVAVDGVDVAPLQPGRRQLWLPLPGRPGVRSLRVRWRYDDPTDSLERPLLQTPVIEGSVVGAALWTVFVPAGFEEIPGDGPILRPGPARAAVAALYRADAQLRVSAALADTAPEGGTAALASAQQRFYAFCRQAEQALQLADGDDDVTGPAGESLSGWLRTLLDENRRLAREHKFEDTRADAEHRSDGSGPSPRVAPGVSVPAALTGPGLPRIRGHLPDTGTPIYLGATMPGAAPALTIRPREERVRRELAGDTALWICLLVAAGVVAWSPELRTRLRPLWPEPLWLLGALAWYRSGFTPVALLLLLLGAAARLLTLADASRHFLRRRRPLVLAPGSSVVGNSGVGNSGGRGPES